MLDLGYQSVLRKEESYPLSNYTKVIMGPNGRSFESSRSGGQRIDLHLYRWNITESVSPIHLDKYYILSALFMLVLRYQCL